MSDTSPQSRDEYEQEEMSHGQVNISPNNIVNDTQMADDCSKTETSNEQSDKHNSTNEQKGDLGCQLPSHVIIEIVQYEDYIKQNKNGHDETNDNEGIVEIEDEHEEECDCDECVNGIEITEDEDDDSDIVQ